MNLSCTISNNSVALSGCLNESVTPAELQNMLSSFKSGAKIFVDFSKVDRANSFGLLNWLQCVTVTCNLSVVYQASPMWLVEQFQINPQYFKNDSYVESMIIPLYCPERDSYFIKMVTVGKEIPILKNYIDFKYKYEDSNNNVFLADFIEENLFGFIAENYEVHKKSIEMHMDLIPWSDSYSIGFPDIDNDHKELIRLINALDDAARRSMPENVVGNALIEMFTYAKKHFAREVELMTTVNYPHMNGHVGQHQAFEFKMQTLTDSFMNGDRYAGNQLLSFLKLWLIEHVFSEDQKLAQFIASRK